MTKKVTKPLTGTVECPKREPGLTFVIYTCEVDTREVLITTQALEKKMLKEWFGEDRRDLSNYDRTVSWETAVCVVPQVYVRS